MIQDILSLVNKNFTLLNLPEDSNKGAYSAFASYYLFLPMLHKLQDLHRGWFFLKLKKGLAIFLFIMLNLMFHSINLPLNVK